jgi:hypothetical protein
MGEEHGLFLLDLDEEMPSGAGGLIIAIPAADICGGAQAWKRINRLIECVDDGEQADIFGTAHQLVASATSCATEHKAPIAQLDQDQLEESLGDLLVGGDRMRVHWSLPRTAGEMNQRFNRIFGSMCKHLLIIPLNHIIYIGIIAL